MSIQPPQVVIWIVDDDIDQPQIIGPFEDCLNAFVSDMAGGDECPVETVSSPDITSMASSGLAKAVRWLKIYKLAPRYCIHDIHGNRGIDFLVYGIKKWDPLLEYFKDKYAGMIKKPFWPHLVFTDIHDGVRKILTLRDDVKALPGYRLAMECNTRQIPCIVITSERTTIENFELWNGLKNIFPVPREKIGPAGYVFDTIKFRLSERLFRTLWIPEFGLTVEGYLMDTENVFHVIFKSNGKVLSERYVNPFSYGFLYAWAYGSKLARLNDWHKELFGWEDSACPAVSIPPSDKEGKKFAQVNVVMDDLFTPKVWKQKKAAILYKGGKRKRPYNILCANILNLDLPCSLQFPACWNNNSKVREKLYSSLLQILPQDSHGWLAKCCAQSTGKTIGNA